MVCPTLPRDMVPACCSFDSPGPLPSNKQYNKALSDDHEDARMLQNTIHSKGLTLLCDSSSSQTGDTQWWETQVTGPKIPQALQVAADRNPIAADRTGHPRKLETHDCQNADFSPANCFAIPQNKKNCDCRSQSQWIAADRAIS